MIPWPIALLAMFYGVVAATSAVNVWKSASGLTDESLMWSAAWLAVSVAVMCGLALLRSWGRLLAVVGAVVFALTALGMSAFLVAAGRPAAALLATLAAGVQVLIIRYLQRPAVKAFFHQGTVPLSER